MSGNVRTKVLRAVGIALIVVGAVILLQFAYTDLYAGFKQQQLQKSWETEKKGPLKESAGCTDTPAIASSAPSTTTTTKPPRPRLAEKEPFARIIIPKIGLDAIVVEGVSKEALKLGPGHMEETAYPGDIGNVVISGHRVTYSRPFYYVDKLEKGDPIHIQTQSLKVTYYVVEKKVVKPTDVSVIKPTDDRTLTLTTCHPRFSARTRLIIVAKMRDEAG